jgi:hypothetical protein
MQDGRPLLFTNKQVCEGHLGKSTYEKEIVAIFHVVDICHPYLGKVSRLKLIIAA